MKTEKIELEIDARQAQAILTEALNHLRLKILTIIVAIAVACFIVGVMVGVAHAEPKTGGPLFVVSRPIYVLSASYKSCGRTMKATWRCRGPSDCMRKQEWLRANRRFFNVGFRLVNRGRGRE